MIFTRNLQKCRESLGILIHHWSDLFRNVLVDEENCNVFSFVGEMVE